MAVVPDYLSNLDVSFYTTKITIAKLLQRYEKCLNSFGNYVKKEVLESLFVYYFLTDRRRILTNFFGKISKILCWFWENI